MTKQEMQILLTEKGIKFDKRWAEAKLQPLIDSLAPNTNEPVTPTMSDEEIKRITDEVSGKNVKPIEDFLKMTTRVDGEARTENGIIIPQEVLAHFSPTKWFYISSRQEAACVIVRHMKNGNKEFVREYSKAVHGDTYWELADTFVAKNNE